MKKILIVSIILCLLFTILVSAKVQPFNATSPVNNSWTNNAAVNGTNFTFTIISNITNNDTNCSIIVNNIRSGKFINVTNNTVVGILNNVTLTEGLIEWYVNCTDNETSVTKSDVSYFLNVDLTNPSVTLFSPENGAKQVDSQPTFYFNYLDSKLGGTGNCTLFIDSSDYGTSTSLTNNSNSSIVASSKITNGGYSWYINCTDNAGNINKSVVYGIEIFSTIEETKVALLNKLATIPLWIGIIIVVFFAMIVLGIFYKGNEYFPSTSGIEFGDAKQFLMVIIGSTIALAVGMIIVSSILS